MKRWVRRLLFALLLFAVAVGAVSLRTVNSSLPGPSDYGRRTYTRLQSELSSAPVCEDAPIEAGIGKAGLTPRIGLPLAGYGDRKGRPSTGVHDSLYVRCLALSAGDCKILLLTLEALIVPWEVARGVLDVLQRQVGLEPRSVYFGATHTHSGAGGWGRGPLAEAFAGPFAAEVVEMFVDSAVAAAVRAFRDLRPAEVFWDQFGAARWTANRLVGERGQIDSLFTFLAVRRDGKPLAVVGSFAAHATVLPAENLEFSGDWPGYWSRALEQEGIPLAAYFAGGVGSHRPKGPGAGFERARAIGEALAQELLTRLPQASWRDRVSLRTVRVPIELGPLQLRISQKLTLAPWLGRKLLRPGPVWLSGLRIGDLVLLGAPADWSGELTNELRATADSLGLQVTVTSFNGGYVGYVVPDPYYPLDEYETRLMSFYGPHTGSYFLSLFRLLLSGLAGERTGRQGLG
ncbi:MAG: neutral/alkaline non-lysosomal ceramidase N-terminal domain-containing protein [candidate division KSB1 bacterium]|nr:neutral/alkaline non-lysosomal ceramidase N-terminal domain-containing protein [candidate division KSB1 bacterium]